MVKQIKSEDKFPHFASSSESDYDEEDVAGEEESSSLSEEIDIQPEDLPGALEGVRADYLAY